jgi:hypothetical protein
MEPPAAALLCFQNSSARKSLILLGLAKTGFLARLSQALDFSGFRGALRRSIPKVIHKEIPPVGKLSGINDLPGFSRHELKQRA